MERQTELLIAAVEALSKDQQLLLLLDYDGTLVEIAPRPELARPTQELIHVLRRIVSLPSLDLVAVSGRSLTNLLELLPIRCLNYLGSHGAEGLIAGVSWALKVDTGDKEEQEELQRQLMGKLANLSGWWLETKSMGFALHYRQAGPNEEERIMSVLESWLAQVERSGRHQILRGKKVVEILSLGVSKGAAIKRFCYSLGAGAQHLLLGRPVSSSLVASTCGGVKDQSARCSNVFNNIGINAPKNPDASKPGSLRTPDQHRPVMVSQR